MNVQYIINRNSTIINTKVINPFNSFFFILFIEMSSEMFPKQNGFAKV